MRTLITLLIMNTGIVFRDGGDTEASVGIMRDASAVDKIADTAGEIAHIVLEGLGINLSIIKAFNNVDEWIVRTKIVTKSILIPQHISFIAMYLLKNTVFILLLTFVC